MSIKTFMMHLPYCRELRDAFLSLLLLLTGISLVIAPTRAGAVDLDEILSGMRQAVVPGDTMRASFELEIINAKGESTRWAGKYYQRGGAGAPRIRFVFESPRDLHGTDVTVGTDGKGQSRTKIYLPAIRRTREIIGDMRGESFLGTDFNYEDLGIEQLDVRQRTLRGEDDVDGHRCHLVESVPDDGWWYGRIVRCVDEHTHLPRRTEYYDRAGVLWKLRTLDHIDKIGAFPTATQTTMRTVPTGTATRLTLSDVEYDVALPKKTFENW